MRNEAIDDGGESASHRQGIAGVSSDGGSYSGRDYHHARVVSLKLHIRMRTVRERNGERKKWDWREWSSDLCGAVETRAWDGAASGRSGFAEDLILEGWRGKWTAQTDSHFPAAESVLSVAPSRKQRWTKARRVIFFFFLNGKRNFIKDKFSLSTLLFVSICYMNFKICILHLINFITCINMFLRLILLRFLMRMFINVFWILSLMLICLINFKIYMFYPQTNLIIYL